MQKSIADAGLIIAYLNASESCHAWAVDLFAHHEFFYTCEAVLSEACARLAYAGIDQSRVIQLAADGVLRSEFNAAGNWERILKLMEKYADQPMDFADACLVAMCEDCRDPMVYTQDVDDFSTYRRYGRGVIPFSSPRPG